MSFFLYNSLRVLGTKIKFINNQNLDLNTTYIFVANHQSLHDIPAIYWNMRGHHPVFVSKKELAKGIPSVSFNLRKSGAALINRSDRSQALKEILKMGEFVNQNKFSAVIFPEGTRRGDGIKDFKSGGMAALLKKCPDALVVPISIKGTRELQIGKSYPLKSFCNLEWEVLQPIDPKKIKIDELMTEARNSIIESLSKK